METEKILNKVTQRNINATILCHNWILASNLQICVFKLDTYRIKEISVFCKKT